MCTSAASIGFIVSGYYIGFAVGGVFCTLPDKYGRKNAVIFGLILSAISQTINIFVPIYWVRFAMFFLGGLAQIKDSTSFVWLSECTSTPYKP